MTMDSAASFNEKQINSELIRIKPETIPRLGIDSIEKQVEYLLEKVVPIIGLSGGEISYGDLLGGSTEFSNQTRKRIDISRIRIGDYIYPEIIDIKNGFSKPWNTGIDINHLINNFPNDRWKFYLSLGITTPEKEDRAISFFSEFAKRCKEQKISLLTKTEDHDYDNPDVYTWQPITMGRILGELYHDSRYSGIWLDTFHFFQRPIDRVSEKHIGLVQEPIGGLNGKSHSGRMADLGRNIDRLLPKYGDKLGYHLYMQAANNVGIVPGEPWRIQDYRLKK